MSWKRISKEENVLRLELYRQGYSDREIAEKVGITQQGVYRWRVRNDLPANKKQGRQKRIINLTPSWELGYFIGIIAGDGSLNKYSRAYTIRVASTSKDYINTIKSIIDKLFDNIKPNLSSFNIKAKLPSGKIVFSKCYAISLCSKELYNFLKKYKPRKFTWIPPYDQPDIVKYGFLGGIIDSDGSISREKVVISSKSKKSLISLRNFLIDLGFIYGKLSINKNSNGIYTLNIYGRENHRLLLNYAKLPYKCNKLEHYINNSAEHNLETYNLCMELYNRNKNIKEISEETGVNYRTVYHWIHNGITPRALKLADKYGKR